MIIEYYFGLFGKNNILNISKRKKDCNIFYIKDCYKLLYFKFVILEEY